MKSRKENKNYIKPPESTFIGIFLFFLFGPQLLLVPFPDSTILSVLTNNENYYIYMFCITIPFVIIHYIFHKRKEISKKYENNT